MVGTQHAEEQYESQTKSLLKLRSGDTHMAKITRINPPPPPLAAKKRVAAYARVSVDTDELMESLSAQVSHYSADRKSVV